VIYRTKCVHEISKEAALVHYGLHRSSSCGRQVFSRCHMRKLVTIGM